MISSQYCIFSRVSNLCFLFDSCMTLQNIAFCKFKASCQPTSWMRSFMLHLSNITWWNNFAAVKIKETAVQKRIWNTSKIAKQFITSNIWFMFHWVGLTNIRVLRLHSMDRLESVFNQLLLVHPEKRHYFLLVEGAMASWLVCSSLEWVVLFRALARDTLLCSWARH